jgi:tetratricopeptide (TPR) repeat protein
MESNPKTALSQKLVLIALGFLFTLVILELGLRLGGFIISSLQERRNKVSLQRKGAYRILCLGESTTAGQYPSFLEEELNSRNIGMQFSVIDKGLDATTTPFILANLESYLDTYHPDIVITMMGINDYGPHMPASLSASETINFWRSLRVYKLAKLLWLHLVTRFKELGFSNGSNQSRLFFRQDESRLAKAILKLNPKAPMSYINLAGLYRKLGRLTEAEAILKQVITFDPKEPRVYFAYFNLAKLYQAQGKLTEAEGVLKQAIALAPKAPSVYGVYTELARLYQAQGRPSEAEEVLKQAIALNPQEPRVCVVHFALARLYRKLNRFNEAEEAFKQTIALNPKEPLTYVDLARLYKDQGRLSEVEAIFKQAIALDPKWSMGYVDLGQLYQDQGRLSEVETVFKQAIAFNPEWSMGYVDLARLYQDQGSLAKAEGVLRQAIAFNPKEARLLYRALRLSYIEMGDVELASGCDKRLGELGLADYRPVTIDNYRRLKAILGKRGIVYVCVQYPMRSLAPLKKIFPDGTENIVVVDNEAIFIEAVIQGRYQDYFIDSFGGDFGHCTDKGNRLLAENIANTILKKVFKY